MHEIITLNKDGVAVVDTITIAEGVHVEHRAVLQLIRKYLQDFEAFGRVAFEMRPFETAGGTQKREIAWLTEDQTTLLFTFLKNTEIARKLKIRLVKAFREAREEIARLQQTPALPDFTNPAIAARAWAEQYEKNQALQAQILLEAPKVQAAEDFLKSDGDHIIRKVAKALGVGVRFLYDWLRQKKIITKFNEPYAEFVTRGYLRPCPSYHEGHDGTRKCDLTTHITNEGIFYIWNRLKKEGHIPEGRQLQLEFLKEAA